MSIPRTKKKVFYPFLHLDRIGEIVDQMFCLRNLYPVDEYDLHVVTYDLQKVKPANRAVFEIATRGMQVVSSDDSGLIGSCYRNPERNNIVEDDGNIYVMLMHSQLKAKLLEQRFNQNNYDYFALSSEELARGEALKNKFKIPQNAKIVCLYVRDGSFFGNDVASQYRNADVVNYFPAIQFLINLGYHVVRIGDNKMKPLGLNDPQFIDTPFHPDYNELVEPYFISQCDFMIGTPSGPLGMALYFQTPVIYTNTTLDSITCLLLHKNTLLLFKKYYSDVLGRCLTYEEILLSPAVDFFRTRLYLDSGITLIDNSPEEILSSVKEMISRLDDSYMSSAYEKIQRRIGELHARADLHRQASVSKEAIPYLPFYSLHGLQVNVSHEFVRLNPWFLGHDWPTVTKWGWEPELLRN